MIDLQHQESVDQQCSSTSRTVHKSNKRHHKEKTKSKHKHHKKSHNEILSTTTFDQLLDVNNESDISENEVFGDAESHSHTNPLSIDGTPTFVGRHVIDDKKKSKKKPSTSPSSPIQKLLASVIKMESQYLQPLIVGQERIETMTKCLFDNQKKIQKALRKQKVVHNLSN